MWMNALLRLAFGSALVAVAGGCRSAPQPTTRENVSTAMPVSRGPTVWSVDLMFVRAGDRESYRRFVEANWAKARRTAQARGEIVSYHALFTPDTSASGVGTRVLLMTEYPDSAAYARREEIFRPILAAQGRTLIDGKSTRELTDSVQFRDYVKLMGSGG